MSNDKPDFEEKNVENCKADYQKETALRLEECEGGYQVLGLNDGSDVTDVFIPSTYKGKDIVSIGNNAFLYNNNLTSVTISDSVKNISNGAFWGCSSLVSVKIPESVTNIGSLAFSGCTSLTEVKLPSKLKILSESIFENCSSLTLVTLPETLTRIGGSAFSGCNSLTSITLPETLTFIGNTAFSGCSSLTDITLPENLTSIGNGAFSGCSNMTEINIPSKLTVIPFEAFSDCSSLTSVIIPDNVTSIGDSAFDNCTNLALVLIESRDVYNVLTGIDSSNDVGLLANASEIRVLASADSLNNAYLNDSFIMTIQEINGKTYNVYTLADKQIKDAWDYLNFTPTDEGYEISGLKEDCDVTEVIIPSTYRGQKVVSVKNNSFHGCNNLISVKLPETLINIGDSAFIGCSGLTSIAIPETVTSIGESAFRYCSNLTSVTFENKNGWKAGETSIDVSDPAQNVEYLTSLYVSAIWTWTDEYYYLNFIECEDGVEISAFNKTLGITSIVIPETYKGKKVMSIANSVFDGTLITQVTIESSEIYKASIGVSVGIIGGLLANAVQIRVLASVDDETNEYLNLNYLKFSQEIDDKLYNVYTRI